MIKIAGIGNGKKEIPLKVYTETEKNFVIIRSAQTAAAAGIRYDRSFDELYENAESFDQLYSSMADEVIKEESQRGEVLYLVDGDGYFDRSVMELFHRRGDLNFITGQGCPSVYTVTISAYEIENLGFLDSSACLKITDLDSEEICGDVKLKLMDFYSDEEEVWMFFGDEKKIIPLYEIDRQRDYDESIAIIIPPVTRLTDRRYGMSELLKIMDKLTAPDGCEWDKAQTHESIRINLIEEAYEAVDAITNGDFEGMIEEFGDVLLQAVFHCVIAQNNGEFTFGDVVTGLCNKLVTRHTHIFGEDKAADASAALGFWEKAKATEKHYSSLYDQLSRLPENFPSLLKAQKLYKKLIKNGYADDFDSADTPAQKLFLAVIECAKAGVDGEVALRELCNQIIERVKDGEQSISKLCK